MRILGRGRRGEQGYVLLILMLVVALMAVAAAVAAPDIAFEIKREREEELIHRGVQYTRAIKHYTKAYGRYPITIDQLRSDGSNRYLRKAFKDPVTGRDFRNLHLGDIYTSSPPPNINGSSNVSSNGSSNSFFNSGSTGAAATPTDSNTATTTTADASSPSGSQAAPQAGGSPAGGSTSENNDSGVGQAIFGVTSFSKKKTIREFYHKNHYNDWLFFYDPTRDLGTEIKGPTSLTPQPLSNFSNPQTQNQQPQNQPLQNQQLQNQQLQNQQPQNQQFQNQQFQNQQNPPQQSQPPQ
jgi:type II secretory pathway pseudopilin PulG